MANSAELNNCVESILIVDDSASQRDFAAHLCQELGIGLIYQANSGDEAYELLRMLNIPPCVVMVDLEMPGMDGIELIQKLHQQGFQIPLLIASSREMVMINSVAAMVSELGQPLLGGLQKPLNVKLLQVALQRYRPGDGAKNRQADRPEYHFQESDLIQAIANAQILPYYQPKVNMQTGMIEGVEALARWLHPDLGIIPPDCFIPLAESCESLIILLTLAIIEQSIQQCSIWSKRGLPLGLSINLSPRLLARPKLFKEITEFAERGDVPNQQIIWEITESSVVDHLGGALATLARLRLKGFGLSIDDFGTGFSSMRQLARIPFTELKVDRSFVDGAAQNPHLNIILASSIDMAKRLDMITVAEGVETLEDWRLLQTLDCTLGQGYFIAKPMPAKELFSWLKTHHLRLPELRRAS